MYLRFIKRNEMARSDAGFSPATVWIGDLGGRSNWLLAAIIAACFKKAG